jgi:EmrB/QacA subfamily drug resistance transporter
VTAYLLASTVVGPLYGKLGDIYGRKRVLQVAIAVFLAGSALCGLSRGITELIAFRALQGLGGGGLMVVTIAVVGDIVPPRDRGRYQGLFGAVFGVSTVLGPLLGGFFVDHLSWRWIFYVNLPLGLVAFAVIAAVFRAPAEQVRHSIDYVGAVLLAGGLAAIVLYTSLGGTTYGWGDPPMIGMLAGGTVLLALFPLAEARAAEPILPLRIFRNPVFAVTSAVGFVVGVALFGATTYLPLYLQTVKGHSPTVSGLLMTPMMAGVLAASITSGQLISRLGRYKPYPVAGTALMSVGLFLLSRLHVDTPAGVGAAYMLVLGLGLGLVIQVLVLAAQNAVEYELLGVTTSGLTLFRQVGGSIGVAVFGAIFANRLSHDLVSRLPPGVRAPTAANPEVVKRLPAPVHQVYVTAVTEALHPVFLVAAACALVAFALTWLLREVPLRTTAQAPAVGDALTGAAHDDKLRHIERALCELARRDQRWELYERLAQQAGLDLTPPELWLLARLGERVPITDEQLHVQLPVDPGRVSAVLARLRTRDLVRGGNGDSQLLDLTAAGSEDHARLVSARRDGLAERLDGWEPDEHPELQRLLDQLTHDLISVIPTPPSTRAV